MADGVEVYGIDWGVLVPRAVTAGVRLHPLMERPAFLDLMAGAQVVVGQHSFGVAGMTELQAMALGRPGILFFGLGYELVLFSGAKEDIGMEALVAAHAHRKCWSDTTEWSRITVKL